MSDRRPVTCRHIEVDGMPVRVRGHGPPTAAELAVIAEFAAFLRIASTPGDPVSATCRSCDSPIVWATTPDGKLMPLDAISHFATCPNAAQHRRPR